MKLYTAKVMALNALLAFLPGFYLRFIRGGRLPRAGRKLLRNPSSEIARSDDSPKVLVVDHDFPDPTLDAGSRAIFHFVELLVEYGVRVTFWSASCSPSSRGRACLSGLGVELAARKRDCDLSRWIGPRRRAKPFDAVVLSRPLIMATYSRDAQLLGSDRCLYYGHDIHYRRLQSMRQVVGGKGSAFELMCMTRIERENWRRADVVLYPSEEEVAVVNAYRSALGMPANAALMPLWSVPETSPPPQPAAHRRGMLFVGSHAHAPNVDGLDWFFTEILPRVRAQGCHDTVYVAGSGMERYKLPAADSSTQILGWLDETALESLYTRVRVALVPLRYGGGVKGKVLEAMAHGVPCVATTAAAQGLSAATSVLDPSDDPKRLAEALVELIEDDGLWARRSALGLAYLHEKYARPTVGRQVTRLVLGR
ncbi:MAG: glycosyltransferase [Rhodanobacter sp.]